MEILIGMLVIGLAINLTPLGRKGRTNLINYLGSRSVKFDDYDAEQKNLDKLMR